MSLTFFLHLFLSQPLKCDVLLKPVVFVEFHQTVGCIKSPSRSKSVTQCSLFGIEGCEAFQVAIPHPGCNLPYRLRRCRMGWPQVLLVRWLLWVTRLISWSPQYLGEDSHVIWYAHHLSSSNCTIYQKSFIYRDTYYIYIYIDMLKHFVFCDAHIQSCSHQQSCGYWSGIFGEVFLRGSYSPGIQTKLMSWSHKHLVIPIPTACYRQQLHDTFCLSAVAIIYTVLYLPYHIYHIYLIIIYYIFHCFTAKYVYSFCWRPFSDRRCWGLSSVGGAGQIRPALVSRTQLFGWKHTFARQIGKEWFCWLAEHPCQCAKLNIKSHPVHGFSSFWCLKILTLTIFNQFLTFEGVSGYLLSLHLNSESWFPSTLTPSPHSFDTYVI